MKLHIVSFRFFLFLLILHTNILFSQTTFPKPDHIVIAILENHSFEQIIGSTAAPYINSLANDTSSALFTASYGITHPSQPNYLVLYSGSTQGVTDDLVPVSNPFTTANLGSQLIDSGKTYITYSEDLPQAGFNGELTGNYARRHNPVTNWMGIGQNQVSPTINQPFTAFPSSNFTMLPTVCFVNPNTLNDMHVGSDPSRITAGDDWISNNLNNYIQWAKTNNSLFILTFDEDNDSTLNHITTIFSGPMILSGQYSTMLNHYSLLHTIEQIYGLPFIGDSLNYAPVSSCWKNPNSLNNIIKKDVSIYPNRANNFFYVELSDYLEANAEIYNLKGELIQSNPLISNKTEINIDGLVSGFYMVKIKNKDGVFVRKFIKN